MVPILETNWGHVNSSGEGPHVLEWTECTEMVIFLRCRSSAEGVAYATIRAIVRYCSGYRAKEILQGCGWTMFIDQVVSHDSSAVVLGSTATLARSFAMRGGPRNSVEHLSRQKE